MTARLTDEQIDDTVKRCREWLGDGVPSGPISRALVQISEDLAGAFNGYMERIAAD